MDDYYNDRPQQVPGAQKKRTSLYDVDASRAQGVEVFENPLRANAAAKTAQLMPASSSENDDAPTIVPTFSASKFVVEEETSRNYMEEGCFLYLLLAYLHTYLFAWSLTRSPTRVQAIKIIPDLKLGIQPIELAGALMTSIYMTFHQTK